MLSIIVAKAKNNVIGKDNNLIWHLPEDLKHFKQLTKGHTIIMGRKTFESLGRVLPLRKHVVFTRNKDFKIEDTNVEIVYDIKDIKKYIDSSEEVFIIGGATIYKMLMPYATKMYITEIDKEFEGDTYFPEIDEKLWTVILRKKGPKDEKNDFNYEFINYERI